MVSLISNIGALPQPSQVADLCMGVYKDKYCYILDMVNIQSSSSVAPLLINSSLWFSWLAGFLDAEGNFQVFGALGAGRVIGQKK
jgi:hypothetical protein